VPYKLNSPWHILAGRSAEAGIGQIARRLREIHAIERVEKLAAKFQLTCVSKKLEIEGALDGHVHTCKAWAIVYVASQVSLLTGGWPAEVRYLENALQIGRAIDTDGSAERWDIGHILAVTIPGYSRHRLHTLQGCRH
jgi:hypothetical protein